MSKSVRDFAALERKIFEQMQIAVASNYGSDPADKKKRGGFLLKSITADPQPRDNQLVFRADNGIPYGLKCKPTNAIAAIFGASAKVRVNADSLNILTLGIDYSNSKEYTLWGDDDEAVRKLAGRMAKNLDMQHRIRTILGL